MGDRFSIRKLNPADGPACCSVNCCTARDLDPVATSPDKYVRDIYEVRMDTTAKLLCHKCLEDFVRTIDGFMENERVEIKKERRPSMKIKGIEIEKNPERLKPGDACWGIYVPAFTGLTPDWGVSCNTGTIHGTLQASYDNKRVDGVGDDVPAHFMPDKLLDGTAYDWPMYDVGNWFVSTDVDRVNDMRKAIVEDTIEKCEKAVKRLKQFL